MNNYTKPNLTCGQSNCIIELRITLENEHMQKNKQTYLSIQLY